MPGSLQLLRLISRLRSSSREALVYVRWDVLPVPLAGFPSAWTGSAQHAIPGPLKEYVKQALLAAQATVEEDASVYWFRAATITHAILIGLLLGLIAAGGWMIALHAFRLKPRERLIAGLALGIGLFIWVANVLGHWLDADFTFWGAAVVVFGVGVLARLTSRSQPRLRIEKSDWVLILLLFAGTLLFTLVGRGLGIFDDRKNLSLISLMAAGDIPPHFYMNSDFLFSYHYAFQLFGAALMRIGHLYPWSAFDLSKGLIASLVILLAFLWAWRMGKKGRRAAALFAGIVLFISGARWLLLLLPPSIVGWAGRDLTLWGSGAQSAATLLQGLSSPWIVEGGPPVAIPFAFVNGIIEPFVLYLQAGPRSLAMLVLFVLLLLEPRPRGRSSWVVIVILLATWGLAAEAEFALFSLGVGLLAIMLQVWRRRPAWRHELRWLLSALIMAGLITLIQGGTITEVVRSLFTLSGGAHSAVALGPDVGFGLRWPPAFVSSHLGEMRIDRPGALLISLFELGPLVVLLPFVIWITMRRARRGDYLMSILGASSLLGFSLPLFLSYRVDRDITRMTLYALFTWLIVCWPTAIALWRKGTAPAWRWLAGIWVGLAVFSGLVVSGPLMTAMARPVFADEITPIDAQMARAAWDRLESQTLVLDSSPWRAVAITGRLTRSSASGYEILQSWQALVEKPMLQDVLRAGYSYAYVDRYWRQAMPQAAWESLNSPCVRLVEEASDNGANGNRWLFDLRGCVSAGS
jgi:hypothetical protein